MGDNFILAGLLKIKSAVMIRHLQGVFLGIAKDENYEIS